MIPVFVGFALLASGICANKFLLATFSPFFLTGIRMLCGGAILAGSFYASRGIPYRSILRDWKSLCLMAVLTTFVQSVLKAYALQRMLSSKAALIGALDPFVTAILAYFLMQERLSVRKGLGIVLGMTGFIYVSLPHVPQEGAWQLFMIFSLPELAALSAMIFGRCGWILAQKFLKQQRYAPPELNGIMMLISGVFSLACSACFESPLIGTVSWFSIGAVFYTIIVGNVIAYTMYAYFLRAYSASFVSLAGFSVPIFVTIYGTILLGEPVSLNFIVAAFIIALAVVLFYRDELPRLEAPSNR